MDNNLNIIIIIALVALLIWCLSTRSKEGLSVFVVPSALNFNNRVAYCEPGYGYRGGAYSGGCFLPTKVIM